MQHKRTAPSFEGFQPASAKASAAARQREPGKRARAASWRCAASYGDEVCVIGFMFRGYQAVRI